MLVELLQASFEAQPRGYDAPATFYLTINRSHSGSAWEWSAGYQDYDTHRILLGTNNCESLEEVGIRLTGRLERYMRLHTTKPSILHNLQESSTVVNTNITKGASMSAETNGEDTQENKKLTHGQELVGIGFNPAGDPRVTQLKQLAAEQIDLLEEIQAEQFPEGSQADYDTNLLQGHAIRHVIDAQMACVKRATWGGGKK